ncbi:MAG: hypothetical protein QOJ94_811 [Sphingomonadales bacterium]|jgi:hypothetical protein|nr:hypothetical protein [Sphingomonadales bacterium]
MRSMVEGARRLAAPDVGPLHRSSSGPPPRSGEEKSSLPALTLAEGRGNIMRTYESESR